MSSERPVCGVGEQKLDMIEGLGEDQVACWNKKSRMLVVEENGQPGTLVIDIPAYCLGQDGLGIPIESYKDYGECVTGITAGIVNPPDSFGQYTPDRGYVAGPLGEVWDRNNNGAIEVSLSVERDAWDSISYKSGDNAGIVTSTPTPYPTPEALTDSDQLIIPSAAFAVEAVLVFALIFARRRLLGKKK